MKDMIKISHNAQTNRKGVRISGRLFVFFSTSSNDNVCNQQASTKKAVALPPGVLSGLAAELAPIAASIYQCLEIGCMCTYLRGILYFVPNGSISSVGTVSNGGCTLSNGQTVRKAVRKEYRVMSDDERDRLHKALNEIKRNGEYAVSYLDSFQ